MKIKSCITLPPNEFQMVKKLRKELGAKSNVEVIRRSLKLMAETQDRERLREAFREASMRVRGSEDYRKYELDALVDEGLD